MTDIIEPKRALSAEELLKIKQKIDEERQKKRDRNYMSILHDYVR